MVEEICADVGPGLGMWEVTSRRSNRLNVGKCRTIGGRDRDAEDERVA